MAQKRNKLQVIRDILEVISKKDGKIKPTHILYKSNLSYKMMNDYLRELSEIGLILEEKNEKSRTYRLTPKGRKYLEQSKFINNFLESFGLE